MTRLRAVCDLLGRPNTWRGVSLSWLLRSPGSLDRHFVEQADISAEQDGDVQIVRVNGQLYAWLAGMRIEPLLQIVSELTTPRHPNQYLWGPTTVERGDIALDIGACEGSFSARVAELGARPIAVEPSALMRGVIKRLFRLRGLPEPEMVGCLLGRESRAAWFIEDPANMGRSRMALEPVPGGRIIEVKRLDDVVKELGLERCDFIKCDAEGADVDIVMSGRETLGRFRPKLAICTYHADDHYPRLRRFLRGLGYRVRGKGFLNAYGRLRVVMLHAW